MRTMCRIEINLSCSLHGYIPPSAGTQWDIGSLQCICRGIPYFEGDINALLPASRRNNEYAASNIHANSRLSRMDFGACLASIENCENNVEIAELMNDNGRRYYSWNFTNRYYGGKSTVEFRQAPGVSTESDCLRWIEFWFRLSIRH